MHKYCHDSRPRAVSPKHFIRGALKVRFQLIEYIRLEFFSLKSNHFYLVQNILFSSSSDGFWIPSDSLTFSKDLNNEKVENSESCPNKFDIMDLPIDEEINGTYAQTIVVEPYKIMTIKDLEPNSSSESNFISLFKMELLLAASAASDEMMDSEGRYKFQILWVGQILFLQLKG